MTFHRVTFARIFKAYAEETYFMKGQKDIQNNVNFVTHFLILKEI